VRETIDLIKAWRKLMPGDEAVLATVVRTSGSTYRKSGARLLLSRNGWLAGSVSGGCLEGDLVNTAWERTQNSPTLLTFDATADDDIVWGFGLGCNGVVEVLLERLPEDGGVLRLLEQADCERAPIAVATSLGGPHGVGRRWHAFEEHAVWPQLGITSQTEPFEDVSTDEGRFFVERHPKPRRLFVFGAGHDAIPLVDLAVSLGWNVNVIDHREAYATPERFPLAERIVVSPSGALAEKLTASEGDAAVLMSHHYLNDQSALGFFAGLPLCYLGQLGPARRTERMLKELGIPRPSNFHAPIGLDIGAEGPHEIALAVMAELQAVVHGRGGGPLGV
jgi:xanthine/CO dehydrogenase XdhC/CoxF family maturation factor